MELTAFYHVYAGGNWVDPYLEYMKSLREAQFPGPVFLGVVGAPEARKRVRKVSRELVGMPGPKTYAHIIVEADEGAEPVTIHRLAAYAQNHDGHILYAHTKGAANNSDLNCKWRHSMERRLIDEWLICSRGYLEEGYDAVGSHWVMHRGNFRAGYKGFFAGNFWMSTCSYLRGLPRCEDHDRWQAEVWVGLGEGKMFDLQPGWPSYELFNHIEEQEQIT